MLKESSVFSSELPLHFFFHHYYALPFITTPAPSYLPLFSSPLATTPHLVTLPCVASPHFFPFILVMGGDRNNDSPLHGRDSSWPGVKTALICSTVFTDQIQILSLPVLALYGRKEWLNILPVQALNMTTPNFIKLHHRRQWLYQIEIKGLICLAGSGLLTDSETLLKSTSLAHHPNQYHYHNTIITKNSSDYIKINVGHSVYLRVRLPCSCSVRISWSIFIAWVIKTTKKKTCQNNAAAKATLSSSRREYPGTPCSVHGEENNQKKKSQDFSLMWHTIKETLLIEKAAGF